MKFALLILFAYSFQEFTLAACNDGYTDRMCGEDLTKLWLDIVIVIDTSKGMTDHGLKGVSSDISSLFVDGLQLGIQPNDPRTSRIGIVTYDKNASEIASLNQFNDLKDLKHCVTSSLQKVSDTEESYLLTGLEVAQQMLQKESFDTERDHYKKLIILYAASYESFGSMDPVPFAKRLKQNGISIATVSWTRGEDDKILDQKLSFIASPGYGFSRQHGPVSELRTTMLQVNCYCPNGWFQMSSVSNFKLGVCLIPVTLQATWTAAKFSCRNYWKNGYLVNEHTQTKHDFVQGLVRNNTAFTPPYNYFIGLSYSSDNWYWEQPSGEPQIALKNWQAWSPGFPITSSTKTVTLAQSSGWQNTDKNEAQYYVCEVATCDSTNYCRADDD